LANCRQILPTKYSVERDRLKEPVRGLQNRRQARE
jgi:hypothetical protein